MFVKIDEEDLRQILEERRHLREQVTSLQEAGTKLREENRVLQARGFVDAQVFAFHRKLGIPAPDEAAELDADRVRYRMRLIAEEFLETVEAAFDPARERPWALQDITQRLHWFIDAAPVNVKLVPFFDGTHDLDYVVAGTRVEFGYRGLPGALEVHRTNMEKEGGPMRADGKVLKPPGWTPPDLVSILRAQGFKV